MATLLDYTRHQAVEQDHLPRVANYDDGIPRVLYWDGIVQSMDAAAWLAQRGPLPADPTPGESAAAILALQQAAQQAQQDSAALRQQVLTLAQSAVGVRVDVLTTPQVRALLALILYKDGALDRTGAVRPLTDWL